MKLKVSKHHDLELRFSLFHVASTRWLPYPFLYVLILCRLVGLKEICTSNHLRALYRITQKIITIHECTINAEASDLS